MGKRRFRYCITALSILLTCNQLYAKSGSSAKRDVRQFPVNNIRVLNIENAKGNITIRGAETDSIKIETLIDVETSNSKTADEIIDQLNFNQNINNMTLWVSWSQNKDYQFIIPFSISYTVTVPQSMILKIKGAYGQLLVDNISGALQGTYEYGTAVLSNLSASTQSSFNLKSCHSNFTDIGKTLINGENCQIHVENCNDLTLETSYCSHDIDNINKLTCQSSFCKYNITDVNHIEFHGNDTQIDIGTLRKYGLLEINKGALAIKNVSPTISELNVANKEAPIKLYLKPDMPFFINGQNEQGEFIYPWPNKIQIIKDLSTTSFSGQNGAVTSLSTKLILFNQLSTIQILKN